MNQFTHDKYRHTHAGGGRGGMDISPILTTISGAVPVLITIKHRARLSSGPSDFDEMALSVPGERPEMH
jgi:hypothetical protein